MAEKKPTFYMMVGVPGSGKTTYAYRIPNAKVLSSDDIRKELGVDGGDKQAHGRVFAILHERVKEALQNGKDVVYDATNITSFRRKTFLKEINDLAGKKVCIYLAPSLAQAIRQNADRDEPVPEQVVRDMDMKLEAPTFSEGWDEMKLMKTLPQRNIDRIQYDRKRIRGIHVQRLRSAEDEPRSGYLPLEGTVYEPLRSVAEQPIRG